MQKKERKFSCHRIIPKVLFKYLVVFYDQSRKHELSNFTINKFVTMFFYRFKVLLFCSIIIGIYLIPFSMAARSVDPVTGEFLVNEYNADVQDLSLVYIFKNSDEYFTRFSKLYEDWLAKLRTVNFNQLSQEDKVDYILLKRNILNGSQAFLHRWIWPIVSISIHDWGFTGL